MNAAVNGHSYWVNCNLKNNRYEYPKSEVITMKDTMNMNCNLYELWTIIDMNDYEEFI